MKEVNEMEIEETTHFTKNAWVFNKRKKLRKISLIVLGSVLRFTLIYCCKI